MPGAARHGARWKAQSGIEMPLLTNARRERFAQEVAKGKTYTEAYVVAGYKDNDGNAAQLAKNPEIQARIMEINGKGAELAEITVASLIAEAEEARKLAMELGQPAAAIGAVREKGVLSGRRVERQESGQPGAFADIDAMTADQLRAFVARPSSPDEQDETRH